MDESEYNASLIWNLVPFANNMFALSEPSIKFVMPYMVLILSFVNVKSREYLLSQRIVCLVAQSIRHASPSFILRSITHGFHVQLIKIIYNNAIDIVTK